MAIQSPANKEENKSLGMAIQSPANKEDNKTLGNANPTSLKISENKQVWQTWLCILNKCGSAMHFKQVWQCNLCNLKPEMACIDQRLKSQRHQKMPSRAHCKSRRTSTTVSNYIHMALCHSQLCHSQLESWGCQTNSHFNFWTTGWLLTAQLPASTFLYPSEYDHQTPQI